jgi:Na+/H+-dicarboxylate symporter
MRQVLRLWSGLPLWQRVVAGLVLGVVVGLVSPGLAHGIAIVGELFTRAIKMLVVPIVLITIAAGITGLGDPRQLGPIGGRTLGLFVITTLIAVAVGMGIGLVVHPGQGVTLGAVVPHALGGTIGVRDQILGIIPVNVLDALARGDMIAIIFFAVLLGWARCWPAMPAVRWPICCNQPLPCCCISCDWSWPSPRWACWR